MGEVPLYDGKHTTARRLRAQLLREDRVLDGPASGGIGPRLAPIDGRLIVVSLSPGGPTDVTNPKC